MYYSLRSSYMYTIYFYLMDSTISHQHHPQGPPACLPLNFKSPFHCYYQSP